MQDLVSVRKFDGSSEPFSAQKIKKSIVAAGGSEGLAEDVFAAVYPKLQGRASRGMITSWAIKEEVALVLKERDESLARSYEEYSKHQKRFLNPF